MKKILLLSLSATLSFCGFAQDGGMTQAQLVNKGTDVTIVVPSEPTPGTEKTTAVGSTLTFASQAQVSGPFGNLYHDYDGNFDSGRLYGVNAREYTGFAQFYNCTFNSTAPADSSIRIVGVVSRWWGKVDPNSTKKVTLHVWSRGTNKIAVQNRAKFFIYGTPSTSLKSQDFDVKTMVDTSITKNSASIAMFSSPLTGVNSGVYVGYTYNYTWATRGADTFGLRQTTTAVTNGATIESGSNDTLVTANNLIQDANGWKSVAFNLGITNGGDKVIFPLIQLECPTCWKTGIGGFEAQNLTFHGAYPNPAVNSANVAFTLLQRADVTITVMDMTGKTINTIVNKDMAPGKNEVRIETSNLAAGNYVYTIENSKGGAVASTLVVAK